MKRYIIRFIVYFILISIFMGLIDVAMGHAFMTGFLPIGSAAVIRWMMRLTLVVYMTIRKPLSFEKKSFGR